MRYWVLQEVAKRRKSVHMIVKLLMISQSNGYNTTTLLCTCKSIYKKLIFNV